jgi:lipopolysaccharide transport system ATP-binding protein
MEAIRVKDLGVKFTLRHKRTTTIRDTLINFLSGKRSESTPGNETFWALRNISFNAKEGESLGILGRNGAGKSTLLQILTGIYRPDEGTVERRGKIGLLQLGTGFHPELTGRENIFLSGAILGLKKREIKALYDSIVSFCELERFIDTPIKTYSSGMTSRLGFAIAINIRPDILLIDEVLAVGDDRFKEKCEQQIQEIHAMGKTILLVSHSMRDVKRICQKAICLDRGQLVFEGSSCDAADFYTELVSSGGTREHYVQRSIIAGN